MERLVKRLVAQELTLSFAPDVEQRLWGTVMRRDNQATPNRVQRQNRLEALARGSAHQGVQARLDLLGISARRMLQALADGETDPAALGHRDPRACHARACAMPSRRVRRCIRFTVGCSNSRGRIARDRGSPRPNQSADGRPAHGTTTRCNASPRSPDSASIPRSGSSRTSARPLQRSPHRSISPPGWAPVPEPGVRGSTVAAAQGRSPDSRPRPSRQPHRKGERDDLTSCSRLVPRSAMPGDRRPPSPYR